MALVTVQRSSVASSPQCAISEGEEEEDENGKHEKGSSECFFAGKGTALVLALRDIPQSTLERRQSSESNRSINSTVSNSSDIQQHLQSMFYLLRHEETLKMAVKLESHRPGRTRYLAIVSRLRNEAIRMHGKGRPSSIGLLEKMHNDYSQKHSQSDHNYNKECAKNEYIPLNMEKSDDLLLSNTNFPSKDIEESCLLGIDCNEKTTIGLVLRILADTSIRLDGDGGFSINVYGKTHIFKPVSVQAMWSALQTLHKVSQKAYENNYYPGGPSHHWVSYYESRIESDRSCLNEWNAMDSIESRRPPSPDAIRNKPTKREETEQVIKMKLKEIMMSVDLDEVTSKCIRVRLEEQLDMDLDEYKSFIDEEILTILGQMDAPTEIFEHVYLGSEWNASNLEELQKNGVRHILNVTREIDNFFPGMFDYFNIRVYDDEKTNLLKYWDNTFKYISRAKSEGSKVLVHCKMGVSRSASVVIAYAMKAYNWNLNDALEHVKRKRNCIKPNKNFLAQLETYRGMLDAMKNKEKLQRSKSETNLKSVKDARLLPGSEPTPLIQALNNSRKSMAGKIIRRSSSSSPKSNGSNVMIIKQQSQSLENLASNKIIIDEQKNVRLPCSNGQNYSVTQNQAVHIQKNFSASNVKSIVNELESYEKNVKTDKKETSINLSSFDEILEENKISPFREKTEKMNERTNNNEISSFRNENLIWTSSAQIIHQTGNLSENPSFENAFHNEELKQHDGITQDTINLNEPLISRQSSCSSVDSAVVLGYACEKHEMVSRHSSWGSGDNRAFASRNSSWGSYDNKPNCYNINLNREGCFDIQLKKCPGSCYEKQEIPYYYAGTTKRTKPKHKEHTFKKITESKIDGPQSEECLDNKNMTNPYCCPTRGHQNTIRCNSEEFINNCGSYGMYPNNSLSVSAPGSFGVPKLIDSFIPNRKFSSKDENQLDNMKQDKFSSNVQNLRMSFEAKANSATAAVQMKGSSLPSSPVALHCETRNREADRKMQSKDISVKGLVSKYQTSESQNNVSNPYKNRPRSFYESGNSCTIDMSINFKHIGNNRETCSKIHDVNKPPVPPILKSTVNVPMTERISSNSNYKKTQQHGKTHPLATLNLSKQRLNAAAYNTM